jgi:aminopeptidase YwaD
MKYKLLLVFSFFLTAASAQDLSFGRKMVDTLTSPVFWGRGYTNGGMTKAATYLSALFEDYGLKPMSGNSFFQEFSYPVNTFPGNMQLTINGKMLVPGKDFITDPASDGFSGKGKLVMKDSARFTAAGKKFVVKLVDKLTWSVSQKVADSCMVIIDKKQISMPPAFFSADIDNKLIRSFKARNICAIVKGTRMPDSILLITAHYDHLGGMGRDTYFPGANDNASGIALLMNLARYYAKHP